MMQSSNSGGDQGACPLIVIRSSGMYGARTIPRQRNLHYSFAAREVRSSDRQSCRGVPAGGTRVPLAVPAKQALCCMQRLFLCFAPFVFFLREAGRDVEHGQHRENERLHEAAENVKIDG